MFNGLTNIGKEYIAKCLAENKPITFTKVKIGDGLLDLDENAELLTDVKSLKKEVEILDKTQEGELTTLTILLDNSDIEVGYYPREIGIYVTDDGVEKLYWYINDGLETQWLCAANKYPIKFKQIINLMTTNLESVIVNWSGKDLFVDREFVEEKIKEKVRTFEIPTIAELQSRKNLKVGDIVEVLGYYTAGDGAGHKRIIANEDDGSGVQLSNKLWANIVHNGEVNIKWLGAKGDGVTDDTSIFEKAIKKYKRIILPIGTFILSKQLNVKDKLIVGSGKKLSIIKPSKTFTSNSIIKFLDSNYGGLDNLIIDGNQTNVIGLTIGEEDKSHVAVDLNFKNIDVVGCKNGGIHFIANLQQVCFENIFISSSVNGIGFNIKANDCFFTNINVNYCLVGMDISTTASKFVNFKIDWCSHTHGNNHKVTDSYGVIFREVYTSDFTNFEIQRCFSNGIKIIRITLSTLNLILDSNGSHEKIPGNYEGEWDSFGNQIEFGVLLKSKVNFRITGSENTLKNFSINRSSFSVEYNYGDIFIDKNSLNDDLYERNIFMNGVNKNVKKVDNIFGYEYTPINFLNPIFFNTSGTEIKKEENLFIVETNEEANYSGIALLLNKDKNYDFLIDEEYTIIFKVDRKTTDEKIMAIPHITATVNNKHYEVKIFEETRSGYISTTYINYIKIKETNSGKFRFSWQKNGSSGKQQLNIKNLYAVAYKGRIEDKYLLDNIISNNFYLTTTNDITPTSQIQQLNTIYHLEKMKRENVYDDYIAYMDEKIAYDKQQRKLFEQRQLAYQKALKENPNLTYEQFMSLQAMTLNLIEEPQPSKPLQDFMKKYL